MKENEIFGDYDYASKLFEFKKTQIKKTKAAL